MLPAGLVDVTLARASLLRRGLSTARTLRNVETGPSPPMVTVTPPGLVTRGR